MTGADTSASGVDASALHVPRGGADWSGPGSRGPRARFTWNAFLWSLVWPQRAHRIVPTPSGVVLIGLAMGIGTAAYNSANNILFITLSLLLACLILSGVLSWFNLRGVAWRLRLAPPLRAGQEAVVGLELRNGKNFLPTYGLWFEFAARPVADNRGFRPESTWTGRNLDVRKMLAQADAAVVRGEQAMRSRLDPRGETRLEWIFKPARRGAVRVELASVVSLFPFGFLKKAIGTELRREVIVWPAPVEYRRHAVAAQRRPLGGERVPRAGSGGDLLALRRYETGDSHRLIHWKASARTRTLLVRQFSAESAEGFALWLRTEAAVWERPEQFELLVSFCATLAEDLFRSGRLTSVALDDEPPVPVRRVPDLEAFLDKLALVQPKRNAGAVPASPAAVGKQNVMTFAPDGARGVVAFVDGNKAASA